MESLEQFVPTKDFLVCIDSDGCVFDTMEIKHKECFCPPYIDHFSLQAISRYAREAWEYTNLYSVSRGMHRFITLLMSLDLLSERAEVKDRVFLVPDHEALRRYTATAPALNNDTLRAEIERYPEADDLRNALAWSLEVNERVGQMVHGIPPFPHVREQLCAIAKHAHIIIVSATQEKALVREWSEHGLDRQVDVLCGQETGTKSAVLAQLRRKKPDAHMLMIGDALGDRKAAEDNAAMFYPIRPGEEAASWNELKPLLISLWNGAYVGEMEDACKAQFARCLPTTPPWKTR